MALVVAAAGSACAELAELHTGYSTEPDVAARPQDATASNADIPRDREAADASETGSGVDDAALPPGAVRWTRGAGGNDHAYLVVCGRVDLPTATAATRALSGHLATLTSKEEDEFVSSLVNAECVENDGFGPWIGLLRVTGVPSGQGANTWHWVTGEPFGFAHWGIAEAVNDSVDQTAVMLQRDDSGFYWADLPATFLVPGYIVEFE
jgi:hypothetical protein